MAFEFKLPDIGEGVVEGEIVQWLVSSGDTVTEDQPLVEIMTDKATVEIPSPKAGTVVETKGSEGDTVPVGNVLVVIDTDGSGAAAPAKEESAPEPKKEEAPEPAPAKSAEPKESAPASKPAAREEPAPAASGGHETATAAPAAAVDSGSFDGRKILAAPAVRKLAREKGIDLSRVPASGSRGRVTREDVEQFAAGGGVAAGDGLRLATEAVDERVPFRGMRRKIAEGMVRSKTTIPHFTYVEEVDVTELKKFREKSKEYASELGGRLTYLPYVIKALIHGFRKYPMLNSTLDEENNEIVMRKNYNIGIAAATPQGLIVPVVKNCESRTMLDISKEVYRVATEARDGKSKIDDLKGGTFTITNLGPMGGLLATPIINFPEVAILGIHKMRVVPKWEDGEWVPRDVMNLSISLDHRLVDGADGAEFLQYVIRYLENPWLLLVESI